MWGSIVFEGFWEVFPLSLSPGTEHFALFSQTQLVFFKLRVRDCLYCKHFSLEQTESMNAAAEGLSNAAKVNKGKIDTVLWRKLLFAGTCEQGTDGQLQSIKKNSKNKQPFK